jgi:hypothetical protein
MNKSNVMRVEAFCPNCRRRIVTTPDEISGNNHDATATFQCPFCKCVHSVFIQLKPFSMFELIDNLNEKEAKELIKSCVSIADPLSQALIRKAME